MTDLTVQNAAVDAVAARQARARSIASLFPGDSDAAILAAAWKALLDGGAIGGAPDEVHENVQINVFGDAIRLVMPSWSTEVTATPDDRELTLAQAAERLREAIRHPTHHGGWPPRGR
jgi:hypothetical protein